jgi:hypothetical protein
MTTDTICYKRAAIPTRLISHIPVSPTRICPPKNALSPDAEFGLDEGEADAPLLSEAEAVCEPDDD